MVADGQADYVPPNAEHAATLIAAARQHLESARLVAETSDYSAAFATAYSGARKAMSAVLAAGGLRIRARGGHWAARVLLCLAYPAEAEVYEEQAWLADVRNRGDYPDFDDPEVSASEFTEALDAVVEIVDLAEMHLASPILWNDDIISP